MNKPTLVAFVLACAVQAHPQTCFSGETAGLGGLPASGRGQILLAQATQNQATPSLLAPRPVTPSNAPNSAPTVTPNANPSATANTSATCTAGCSAQFFSCSGPCRSTQSGTTIFPSQTTVGITRSPGQCLQNCSTQV